ncbi:MAG: phosphoenolpyruvate--protein phosphotransferase [Thermoprotei archaeon]|nr:MAG: phosphoenolpyruvate--protein phosphotransferase [Thermoprotei archaeon]
MIEKKGIPTSPGIAIGKAFVYKKANVKVEKHVLNTEAEIRRFEHALEETKKQIKELKKKALKEMGEEKAAIFDAHLMILEDPAFTDKVLKYIRERGLSAEEAVVKTARDIAAIFEIMEDEYMKARAEDIRDLGNQILEKLAGTCRELKLEEPSIIIARELLPSDTVKIKRENILGFVTELGGVTSHVSIIARAMGVPAVVGIKNLTQTVKNGDVVIIDGYRGVVIVNPEEEILKTYREKMEEDLRQREEFKKIGKLPAVTKDGVSFEVAANIGEPSEVYLAMENGADGIGLLRTEFLVMGSEKFPSEEKMTKELKKIIARLEDKPVIVRTLDIGGDKPISCLKLPKELNPFLGLRGIRLSLNRKEIFKSQLKAILRNNTRGNIKIMFPMVSLVEEVTEARKIVEEVIEELKSEGVKVGKTEIGIMVETPSAALMVDALAEHVDFFSIGTNDLTQYTLAVDRTNEHVAYIFDHLHPSVLKLVNHVVEKAHEKGKWVGVCGEIASDIDAIPILVGLRVDELSVAPLFIPRVKRIIRFITYKEARELAFKALKTQTAQEVRELSRRFMKNRAKNI